MRYWWQPHSTRDQSFPRDGTGFLLLLRHKYLQRGLSRCDPIISVATSSRPVPPPASASPSRSGHQSREKPKDEPYAGPYYVVFNASGGWDTTYLMDPKGAGAVYATEPKNRT